MKQYNNITREDEIIGAAEFWDGMMPMEVCTNCKHFERRGDFDAFSMVDYQSCENCRHLGPENSCLASEKHLNKKFY